MGTQKRIMTHYMDRIHITSPEIFPMFTEAMGDIIFICLTVLSNFPDVSATGGLSKEATVALSVVGAIVLLCIVLAFTFCCFIRRQQKQIAEYRSQFFVKHSGEYQVNIRAKVNIQTCIKRSPLGNSLLAGLTNLKVIQ